MQKVTVRLGSRWFGLAALAPLLGVACAGSALSMGDMTGGSAGDASAGTSSSGGGTTSSGGSSAGTAGSSQETCDKAACGPQLGLPNEMCADGSIGGPTGRCLKNANGSCGWEIRQCPPDMGAGGEASGGSSGTGGASGGTCGGAVCKADQVCCGPAECGFCVSKLSGIACPATCSGGGGSGGTGGASDCAALLEDVNQKQAAAQACNPSSAKPTPECQGSLEGRCCPIGVESASSTSPANAAYMSALKTYKASCKYACPAIACFEPKIGDCRGTSATAGKCYP